MAEQDAWVDYVPGRKGKAPRDFSADIAKLSKAGAQIVYPDDDGAYAAVSSITARPKDKDTKQEKPSLLDNVQAAAKAAGITVDAKIKVGTGTNKGFRLVVTRTK